MGDRAKKISELTALSTATGDDLLVIVDDPSGNAVTKSVTVTALLYTSGVNVKATAVKSGSVPANSSASGTGGDVRFDSDYVYVCVANNTWKRASLNTW